MAPQDVQTIRLAVDSDVARAFDLLCFSCRAVVVARAAGLLLQHVDQHRNAAAATVSRTISLPICPLVQLDLNELVRNFRPWLPLSYSMNSALRRALELQSSMPTTDQLPCALCTNGGDQSVGPLSHLRLDPARDGPDSDSWRPGPGTR